MTGLGCNVTSFLAVPVSEGSASELSLQPGEGDLGSMEAPPLRSKLDEMSLATPGFCRSWSRWKICQGARVSLGTIIHGGIKVYRHRGCSDIFWIQDGINFWLAVAVASASPGYVLVGHTSWANRASVCKCHRNVGTPQTSRPSLSCKVFLSVHIPKSSAPYTYSALVIKVYRSIYSPLSRDLKHTHNSLSLSHLIPPHQP